MTKPLDERSHATGCRSTPVWVLASRYAHEIEPLVSCIEAHAKKAEGDAEATCLLAQDIAKLEMFVQCSK